MKIKCITNSGKDIPPEILAKYADVNSLIPLIVNKEYIVYSFSEYYQSTWYCICDESYTYYPMWIPQNFFKIIDNRISRYWICFFKEDVGKNRFFFGFPEWASQLDFYDKLVDGEAREVQLFKAYKERMDFEFPDTAISQVAQIGDNEWLICPVCFDAWLCSNAKDALVRCPSCQNVFNNPRYKNEWPHL